MNNLNAAYAETLRHLYPRRGSGPKLGLETPKRLLERLGNPQCKTQHIVVAGTNGKGSVASLLAHALQGAGYRVGLYTSPHLLRFTERIRINGKEISHKRVIETFKEVADVIDSTCEPTFFEYATGMAFLEFAQQQVDICVLEVGLGGRLDATNVVDRVLSVITPVGLDHQRFLGNTIQHIAEEKAGVIQHGVPVVVAPQDSEARQVLRTAAWARQAPWVAVPMSTHASRWTVDNWLPPYQESNIDTARAALEGLARSGFHVSSTDFERSLHTWTWRGRYDWRDACTLFDAAHNTAAAEALAQAWRQDPRAGQNGRPRPLHVVFTSLHDKSAHAIMKTLSFAKQWYLAPVSVPRSRSVQGLAKLLDGHTHGNVYPTAATAFAAAQENAKRDDGVVLVTGSIFLLSELLPHHDEVCDPPIDC